MKKIVVKYIIEVPENHIDKVCRVARCGKRDLENDIKEMAEVSGRHRVYEFIEPYTKTKIGELNERQRGYVARRVVRKV